MEDFEPLVKVLMRFFVPFCSGWHDKYYNIFLCYYCCTEIWWFQSMQCNLFDEKATPMHSTGYCWKLRFSDNFLGERVTLWNVFMRFPFIYLHSLTWSSSQSTPFLGFGISTCTWHTCKCDISVSVLIRDPTSLALRVLLGMGPSSMAVLQRARWGSGTSTSSTITVMSQATTPNSPPVVSVA